VSGVSGTVEFEIIASDGEIIETLSFVASDQGDVNLPWLVPKDTVPGIYTVRVTDTFGSVETEIVLGYYPTIIEPTVVINEVDINPPGDDSASISEWVELYNPTDSEINLGGWEIASTTVLKKTMTILAGTTIQPGEFLTYSYQNVWFTDSNESVELRDENGIVIDKTPLFSDLANDFTSWQRIYDGLDTDSSSDWKFVTSTTGSSNGKLIQTQDIVKELGLSSIRLDMIPGDIVTVKNNDGISHSLISGKENSGDRYDPFTPDGRISTGDIAPGESTTITFDDLGIYKLYDPDTGLQKIIALVFENNDKSNITVIFPNGYGSELTPENNLSDKAIKMFEKKIDRWNDKIERLNVRVDKLELKGKLERADELRAKILVFESLVNHLESLIH